MHISEEAFAAHRRTFLEFLDQDVSQGFYLDEVRNMIHHKRRRRLIVNISDLHDFNSDLARQILRNPSEYIQLFSDVVTEVTRKLDPKYLKEGEQVHVGFDGPFVSRRVTPRELLSEFIG